MSNSEFSNRTIALAAIFQAANLVDRLATQGQIPPSAWRVMLDSLFVFDSASASDIYTEGGGQVLAEQSAIPQAISQSLSLGFRVARQVFADNATHEYPQTIRYVMSLIKLEKQFSRNAHMQEEMHQELKRISDIKHQLTDAQIAEQVSAIYTQTLAKLPFRIQVLGKMQYLQNRENEHQVRLLLLAGIRAAMLWKQLGGRGWHFIFYKSKIAGSLQKAS